MIYQTCMALAMLLIALTAGTGLMLWLEGRERGRYLSFAKGAATVAVALAVLGLLAFSYFTFTYWRDGTYNTPRPQQPRFQNSKIDLRPGGITVNPMKPNNQRGPKPRPNSGQDPVPDSQAPGLSGPAPQDFATPPQVHGEEQQ